MAKLQDPWTFHARRFLTPLLAKKIECLLVLSYVAFLARSQEQRTVKPVAMEEVQPQALMLAPAMTTAQGLHST